MVAPRRELVDDAERVPFARGRRRVTPRPPLNDRSSIRNAACQGPCAPPP